MRTCKGFDQSHSRLSVLCLIWLILAPLLLNGQDTGPSALFRSYGDALLPIRVENRRSLDELKLTQIGDFARLRKARPGVPAHLHTGIDICRPGSNYGNEPIYAILSGEVISVRYDGAFAQIIVKHMTKDSLPLWSVYEHISGILVQVGDLVSPARPLARFMNRDELDRYGWQFDHFHLEVMQTEPYALIPTEQHPQRFYASYALTCFTDTELQSKYLDPLVFLSNALRQ